MTHEEYLHAVLRIGVSRLNDPKVLERVGRVKLVYGLGKPGLYGHCLYRAWENGQPDDLVEICASGEESALQLAATVFHEFAHCLEGWGAGHGQGWRRTAKSLGLARPRAAGWNPEEVNFAPDVLELLVALGEPTDGRPILDSDLNAQPGEEPRPCPLGVGTRGGVSRGPGSGSRLRLYVCNCVPPVRVRVARDHFNAMCGDCTGLFKRASLARGASSERVDSSIMSIRTSSASGDVMKWIGLERSDEL